MCSTHAHKAVSLQSTDERFFDSQAFGLESQCYHLDLYAADVKEADPTNDAGVTPRAASWVVEALQAKRMIARVDGNHISFDDVS